MGRRYKPLLSKEIERTKRHEEEKLPMIDIFLGLTEVFHF